MRMGEVLEHLAADHGVEALVGERQRVDLDVATMEGDRVFAVYPGKARRRIADVDADAVVTEFREEGEQHAVTAADIEYAAAAGKRHGDVAEAVDAAGEEIAHLVVRRIEELSGVAQTNGLAQQTRLVDA